MTYGFDMGLFDGRSVKRDDQCNNTDKEVLSFVEDWQCEEMQPSARTALLLEKAAQDRHIDTNVDGWVLRLAERCGRKISIPLPIDIGWGTE